MKAGEASLLFLISSFFCFPPPPHTTPPFPGFVQKHKRVIHHFSSSTRSALTSPSPLNPSPPGKGTRSPAKKALSREGKAPQLLRAAPAQRATFSAGFGGCQPPKGEGQDSAAAEMQSQRRDISGGGGKPFAPAGIMMQSREDLHAETTDSTSGNWRKRAKTQRSTHVSAHMSSWSLDSLKPGKTFLVDSAPPPSGKWMGTGPSAVQALDWHHFTSHQLQLWDGVPGKPCSVCRRGERGWL